MGGVWQWLCVRGFAAWPWRDSLEMGQGNLLATIGSTGAIDFDDIAA
jgi:hypothetical protein